MLLMLTMVALHRQRIDNQTQLCCIPEVTAFSFVYRFQI